MISEINRYLKFSIVIPVFNVEKYLRKCIDSLLQQSYRNFEIILVDDGSTDTCPSICDSYALNDERVKVIHKSNGGSSSSRNQGIQYCSGDYVMFVDSDDYWDSTDALKELAEILSKINLDVLCFGCKKINISGTNSVRYFDTSIKFCTDKEVFKKERYISSPWTKVINRTLLCNKLLCFREGVTSEDIEWSFQLALKAKKIAYIDLDFYCYVQRPGSISHLLTEKKLSNLKDNVFSCIESLERQSSDIQFELLSYVSYQYAMLVFDIASIQDNETRKKYLDEVFIKRSYLKYSKSKKVRMMWFVNNVVGFKNMCSIMRIYQKCKKIAN